MAPARVEPLFGCCRPRTKLVIVESDDGPIEVLVKQPTMAQRQAIMAAGKMSGDGRMGDISEANVRAVLECACHAEGKRRFNDHDLEMLRSEPAGGWIDTVAAGVFSLLVPAPEVPVSDPPSSSAGG